MKTRLILIVLAFLNLWCGIAIGKDSVVLRSRNDGFFSIFFDVMGLVRAYENNWFHGIEVDFDTTGLYYDPQHGPNWWSYYFEPISYEVYNKATLIPVKGGHPLIDPNYISIMPRDQVFGMIRKYVKIKPHVKEKIDQIVNNNFVKYRTIGVHFRGTDKVTEVPRVAFDKVANHVFLQVAKFNTTDYKIYVASDEWGFIDYMISLFGDKICYNRDAIHSTNGQALHTARTDPYKQGEDALIDSFCLACTDYLIRTSSNLSLCSTFFNPYLPVILVK